MRAGAAEFRALLDAAERTRPGCRGDWRFVLDAHELDPADITELRDICLNECPLLALCNRYAKAARPPSGMWAGTYYPIRATRRKEAR